MKRKHFQMRAVSLLAALALLAGLLPAGLLATPALAAETASTSVVDTHYSDDPDAYEIYPVPHSVKTAKAPAFTLTTDVNVVVGADVDKYTTDFLADILERFGHTMTTSTAVADGKSNIVLAIHGDSDAITPAAYPDLFTAADKYDPYLLRAEASSGNQNGVITIIGKNADCVYYGVATLQMMFTSFNGEKFLPVQIEDYSNTVFRGFIEGFYGGFDYTGRESQMRAIRDVKGNMYVFASKTDPYHGSNWSGLYPTEELNQIKHLVDVGKETKVNYTWSVHIGKGHALDGIDDGTTINEALYTERLNLFKAKFQQLYNVGVRSFNVLNDDYNSGTYRVQVELLNDINAWLKEKGDCMPLIYCCAGYNTAWAGTGAELQALAALDDDIYLYWTGSNVNSPITQENIDYPNTQSGQPIVTWLNYPCSEHAGGRGIFLGDISHYMKDADGITGQYGLLSNGISSPEANKVAYFQLFSWCWNRDNYTEYLEELWEDCFKYLQPEVYESYLTIARNVSNCPNSGRIPNGFPESEYIRDELAAVQTALLAGSALADIPEAQDLLDELDNILAAVADFRANCENTALKAELEPWLKSLTDVATAAIKGMKAADMLTDQDVSGAWNAFSEGAVALGKWDAYPSSNPNVTNNVKAGSLRLQPFANAVLDYVEEAMAQQFNPGGGLAGDQQVPIIRIAGTERSNDANAQKMFDGNKASFASYETNQKANDYIGVDLGEVKIVTSVDILQGQSDTHHDYFHKATVEYSADGEHWATLVPKVNSHHILVEDLSVAARYVRMRLLEAGYQGPNFEHNGGANYWTYIREFTVATQEPTLLYTDLVPSAAAGLTAATDGGAYILTIPSASLAAGQSVGLRLPNLMAIQTVSTTGTLPSGVVLEYSVNGESWTSGAPSQTTLMGYVRLRATAAATLENVTLTVSEPVETVLSFVASNVGVSSGSWNNVVDGDRSTLVHTNTRQAYGQYAIFDLSAKQPVHDVTVWIPESGDDIPHNLDVFVGDSAEPSGEWELVAELRDNHYDMDVPYRYFSCDGEGKVGRYIKLAIADITAYNWFQINELEVNTTVAQQELPKAESATSGNAANASDSNLLTFLAPDAAAGSWQKLLQSPTTFTSATILRGADGATAVVEVQKNNVWQQVGTLFQSATTIQLSEAGAITGLRISWSANDVPAIAEIVLSGAAAPAGDAPTLYPNIYEQPTAAVDDVTVPNGTAIENLPLPETVSVTTSGGITTDAPVTWSCETYDAATAGEYTFLGVLGGASLTNPGCFTLTATVTVRAAEGETTSTGSLLPSTPTDDANIWASGREVASQSPKKAVDNDTGSWWSGNKMKQKDNSSRFNTIQDAVSWITVDLGAGVDSITQITMLYNAKVWPLEYYVQIGASSISYDGYTTPTTDTSSSTSDTTDVTYSTGYADTMHALNAPGWTTIYTGTRTAGDTANPTITLGEGGEAFAATIPSDARYLRLYYTQINPNALGGTGIGLKELTVTGTRTTPPSIPNIASVSAATAKGVVGDAWDDLTLPTHVVATLEDNTTTRVAVTWDGTGYDATAATQTFTGTLTPPEGVTNTANVTATLTVTLAAPPTVVSYTLTPDRITASHGTAFADLGLTADAVVQFSNGETRTLPVTWDASSYSPTVLGDQDVSGAVALPWGGNTHTVTILVNLTPILSNRVTLDETALTLYVNEGHANHTAVLTATVGPENATDKGVIWRTSDISVAAVNSSGTVTAMGVGTATITATAHDGSLASATCTVTVKAVLGGSVSIAKPSADADYYFDAELSAALNQLTPQAAQDSLTYVWKRGNDTVGTEETYTPVQTDIDQSLTLTVTASAPYEGSVTSAPVTIRKAPGPALKTTPKGVACTTEDNNDGKITGLTAGVAYDISSNGGATWVAATVTDGVIENLESGTYHIRRAETATHTAGPRSSAVTVAAYNAVTYNVDIQEVDGGQITADNSAPTKDAPVTLEVIAETGYRMVANSLTVTTKDSQEDVTLTPVVGEEGKFTFTMPEEDVTVSAEFEKLTFTIVHALKNISCNMEGEHSHTVEYNDKPTITLKPDTGYDLPQTLKVYTKASVDADPENPVEFNGYTYRPNSNGTATITFSSGITQDVVVSGEGVVKTYIIDHQLTDISCNMGGEEHHKVAHGEALTIQLTAAQGYYLPEKITVTMSDQPFEDFTYTRTSDTEGQLAIAENKITGPLVVSGAGVIPLTSVTVQGTAQAGQDLTAQVRPSAAKVSYQWFRGETAIENATGKTYTLTDADVGAAIKVEVTGVDGYIGTKASEPVGPVAPAPVDKAALQVAYTAALEVENENYTAASWNTFQQAIANALAVLKNADATQAEVDAAAKTLTDAQKALKKLSSGGSSVSTPSEPTDKTETKENEDGSVTTTETKPDGTVIETTEKPDGTKEVVKTQPDGTVMEIVVAPDGTKESMMTRPDGTVTETVEKPDGTKVEKVTDPEENVTITATDAEGETVAEVKVPAVIPEAEKRFEDVPVGHWADEAIHKLAAIEVVNGVTDTQYSPVVPMKRGDLATVLFRLSNGKEGLTDTFADVESGKYYADGIAWAAKAGVVEGFSDTEFRPEQTITREQLALMLMRYAKLLGVDTSADAEALNAFADGGKTSSWAVDGVAWCVKAGIIQGMDDVTLSPNTNVSRAQVAVMLQRFIDLVK